MRRNLALRVSPQSIDPLSWFTRPLVPVAFATTLLLFGIVSIGVARARLTEPAVDIVGVLLMALACLYVQVRTRPFRKRFGPAQAVIALGFATAGLALSTWANLDSTLTVQFWWAPVGVGVVIATLGPYSTVLQVIAYGSVMSVITGVAGTTAFLAPDRVWPPLSVALIASGTVVTATVATAVFGYVVVSRTQALLTGAGTELPPSENAQDAAARRVERRTVARLGSRVAPFLESVSRAGVVTDADRALAGQLARQLRSDLVEQANSSWLDTIAAGGRIFIVDPDHRADDMNPAQRSVLRGLLLAVIEHPSTDAGSLFIELRGQDDGSTAVALSLDVDLPEGRRVMMLAPYLLALQTTVEDVSWDPARELLRFQVPRGRA